MSFLINPFFFAAAGGGGGTTPTTWNPSDKTNTTLSSGDLVATIGGGNGGVRGIAGRTSGKVYCEYTYTTINTNSINTGISLIAGALNGASNTGIAFVARTNGAITVNGSGIVSFGIIAQSSVIAMAVDFGANLLWMHVAPSGDWNGNALDDPATGVGGVDISSISTGPLYPLMRGGSGDVITANFGASGFTGTVPSGFTSGWLGPP